MNAPIIIVENIAKRYRLSHQAERQQYVALRDVIADRAKRLFRRGTAARKHLFATTEEFWALKDISFEVKQGDVVGIIGRNGAGKSTLLKLLSRITEPTRGRIRVRGRIASLLEVGTGFHPELTGRENIYLNGAILGMTREEIRHKFDEIVAFAEVERFLDTPVKRYSSGMYVRLAFAVAAHLEPEILIVDEVLAVGDVQFQQKCLSKMDDVSRGGRTVLFVSHNMAAVRQLTSRSIILNSGEIAYDGDTNNAIDRYSSTTAHTVNTYFDLEAARRSHHGTGAARLLAAWFGRSAPLFEANEDVEFFVRIRAKEDVPNMRINMTVFARNGTPIGASCGPSSMSLSSGEVIEARAVLPCPRLAAGEYYCAIGIGKGDPTTGQADFDAVTGTLAFEVAPEEGVGGTIAEWHPVWGSVRFLPLSNSTLTTHTTTCY